MFDIKCTRQDKTTFNVGTFQGLQQPRSVKAALSVTFDLLIFEIMFLFFKNTVKKLKFRYTFYQFRKSLQIISIKKALFVKIDCL